MADKNKHKATEEEILKEEAEAKESTEQENEEATADESQVEETQPSEEEQESERYMRLMAEFQNYKKRAAKEKSDIHAYANEKIVGDLLPVLDNFERALASTATDDPEGYAKGMALIFEQMKTALEKAGLQAIDALGQDFDPTRHNAVVSEDSEEYDSGKISKELQKGYSLNGKVVRPTMVAVAK